MKLPLKMLSKKKAIDKQVSERPSAKVHYIRGEKFKVVRPLARDMPDAVSFSVVGKIAWFLRVRGQYCFLEPKKQSRQFGAYSSTFFKEIEHNKKIPTLGRGCLKLRPLAKDKFKVVRGLDKFSEEAVSFEFVRRPGWFIRPANIDCFIDKRHKNADYEKDCSFFPLVNLWFQDFAVFESVQKAAHYLRMKDGRLILAHYDGTTLFKEEASFKMGLKNGFLCTVDDVKLKVEDTKVLLQEDEFRCGSGGLSDCVCSDCVSVVSFQIYEENAHVCECSHCEVDYLKKEDRTRK